MLVLPPSILNGQRKFTIHRSRPLPTANNGRHFYHTIKSRLPVELIFLRYKLIGDQSSRKATTFSPKRIISAKRLELLRWWFLKICLEFLKVCLGMSSVEWARCTCPPKSFAFHISCGPLHDACLLLRTRDSLTDNMKGVIRVPLAAGPAT